MSDKFWNFSKAERIAAIALTIIIVLLLAVSLYNKKRDNVPSKDYRTEIEEFKNRVVPTDTVKEKKTNTPKENKKGIYTQRATTISVKKRE